MICRGTMKAEAFLSLVDATLGREPKGYLYWADRLRNIDPSVPEDGIVYFGAGYWRGRLVFEGGKLKGVHLINGDYTREQRAKVEEGVALLIREPYEPDYPAPADCGKFTAGPRMQSIALCSRPAGHDGPCKA